MFRCECSATDVSVVPLSVHCHRPAVFRWQCRVTGRPCSAISVLSLTGRVALAMSCHYWPTMFRWQYCAIYPPYSAVSVVSLTRLCTAASIVLLTGRVLLSVSVLSQAGLFPLSVQCRRPALFRCQRSATDRPCSAVSFSVVSLTGRVPLSVSCRSPAVFRCQCLVAHRPCSAVSVPAVGSCGCRN